MKYYVLVGMGTLVGAGVLFGRMGVDEPRRMDSFIRSYDSRRVEEGAAMIVERLG